VHGFDNQPLMRALQDRGFAIDADARSNYLHTRLSLASTLNLDHLATLGIDDIPAAETSIQDPRVQAIFDALGYETVHVRSGWGPTTSKGVAADRVVDCKALTEVERLLVGGNVADYLFGLALANRRANIDCAFDTMAAQGRREGPTFTFVHVVAPHPPFLFHADGSATDVETAFFVGGWADSAGYVGQLQYLNHRLTVALDEILAAGGDPLIVVQGDHGSRHLFSIHGGMPAGPRLDDPRFVDALEERAGILNAIRWPRDLAPANSTPPMPVNTFRLVLAQILGTGYEPVPECTYYATAASMDLYPVTDVWVEPPPVCP